MPHDRERRSGRNPRGISRRRWLSAIGMAGAIGVAGCSGANDDSGSSGSGNNSGPNNFTNGSAFGTAQPNNSSSAGDLPEVGGTYSGVISTTITTLNPLYNTSSNAGGLIEYALSPGYRWRPGSEYVPFLYDLSTDNGSVWVADVRQGLQFGGDYGEVTAEDFVYVINEIYQSDWAAASTPPSFPSDVNVTQTGTYQFQIELPSPNALYPETYDPVMYAIPQDLVRPFVENRDAQGLEQNQELLELQFTGNLGPYTLDQWNRSSNFQFSRNENYFMRDAEGAPEAFSNAPYFDSLEVQIVQEEQSRLGALEAGETDVAELPPNRVSRFQNLEGVDVYVSPRPYNAVCAYNMRDNGWSAGPGNLFRNQQFRQGLGCAVNKERLVRGVYNGFADPEYTWQPRWSEWYPESADIMQFGTGDLYGSEPTRNRIGQAISNTEYSYDGDTLLNPSGDQVSLGLYHSAGDNTEQSLAQYVAQEFNRNAGINVNVQAIDNTQFTNNYWQQRVPANPGQYEWSNGAYNAGPREVTSANAWDMSVAFGLNTYPLNPTAASAFFLRDSTYNPYGYYPSWNAQELFDRAANATSRDELQPIFTEIFQNIARDQPMGMLAFPSYVFGYSAGINGPQENFFDGWDFPAWYREQ